MVAQPPAYVSRSPRVRRFPLASWAYAPVGPEVFLPQETLITPTDAAQTLRIWISAGLTQAES